MDVFEDVVGGVLGPESGRGPVAHPFLPSHSRGPLWTLISSGKNYPYLIRFLWGLSEVMMYKPSPVYSFHHL